MAEVKDRESGEKAARCAGRVGGRKRRMTDGKVQAARKAIGKRDAAQRGGAQLRRVGSHAISMGTGFFTDVTARRRRWTPDRVSIHAEVGGEIRRRE